MSDMKLKWVTEGAGDSTTYEKTYTGGTIFSLDEDVPVAADQAFAFALDVSQVKAIEIVADGALTLETNSSSSPAHTIVLVANVPYRWCTDSYNTNLLTSDVTSLFVTNAGSATRRLRIKGVLDPSI